MSTQIGFLILFFLLNLLSMFLFYRFLRSRFSRGRLLTDLRAEVDTLIVDLGREADRDVALLESRIKNLRSLMDEADRRIVLSDRETDRRRDQERVMTQIRVSEKPVVAAPVIEPVAVTAVQPVTIYTRQTVRRAEKPIEAVVPLQEKVLEMHRKGISADMIASTLSVSMGEVDLIVAMNSSSL